MSDDQLMRWQNKWLKMSVEKQFESAVSIIKNLPKDGPYQPSNEMMLKFYGYYKQATLGPCNDPKPSFWDVIRRAKYDAWHKLGDMSSEQAMMSYVEELKMIIETMSFSEDVADFMATLGPFYESIEENDSNPGGDSGIELEPGNVNALLGNFDEAFVTSGQEMHLKTQYLESKVDQMMAEMTNVQKLMNIPEPDEVDNDTDDDDEEQYLEVSEDFESTTMQHVVQEEKIDDAIKQAVHQLNNDVGHLTARVSTLERLITDADHVRKNSKQGFLGDLSSSTTAFVIVWPLAAFAVLKFCTK